MTKFKINIYCFITFRFCHIQRYTVAIGNEEWIPWKKESHYNSHFVELPLKTTQTLQLVHAVTRELYGVASLENIVQHLFLLHWPPVVSWFKSKLNPVLPGSHRNSGAIMAAAGSPQEKGRPFPFPEESHGPRNGASSVSIFCSVGRDWRVMCQAFDMEP